MRAGFGLAAAAALGGALALAGCDTLQPGGPGAAGSGPPPPSGPAAFDAAAFAWSEGAGPGSLAGRVAYRSAAGERWTCAAQTVALIPATRYSAERMQALYGSREAAIAPAAEVRARSARLPAADYGRFVRTASCDEHDDFSLEALQPGAYFLIASARPRGRAPGPEVGVVVMQRVHVGSGLLKLVVPAG